MQLSAGSMRKSVVNELRADRWEHDEMDCVQLDEHREHLEGDPSNDKTEAASSSGKQS